MVSKNSTLWKYRNPAAIVLLLLFGIIFLNRALFPQEGYALGAHDTRGLFLPWINFVRHSLANGRLPLWNPFEFAGYPFLSNPQVGFFYPIAWLTFLLPANIGLSWYTLLHLWLAAAGMFLFVRYMGAGWLGSLLSAVIFSFSGFTAARLWAGHFGVVATFAWLPWILLSLSWSVKRRSVWSAVIAGSSFGLAFLAGHTPSFIYVLLIWGAFGVYLIIGEKRPFGLVLRQGAVALLVGVGLAAVQLIPFIELIFNSQRASGIDFNTASEYSLPPAHLITLLLPEFFGEPVRAGYWSVQSFEELTYYAGIMAVVGLVLALRRPSRLTWFYLILILVGIWLAMGRYSGLYNVLFNVFPPIRMLRAPGRAAVLYLFASSALVGHAISNWQSVSPVERRQALATPIKWLMAISVTALLVIIGFNAAKFLSIHPTDTSGRIWHQIGAYSFALLVILLIGGLIWALFSSTKERSRKTLLIGAALIIVVIADLWQFGTELVQLQPVDNFAIWEESEELLIEPYNRVLPWGLSIFEQNGATENLMPSVFGYQALEPDRLIGLVSYVPDPRSAAYDIVAASHVVSSASLDQFTEGEKGLKLVAHSANSWVYQRPEGLPVARIVFSEEVAALPSKVIDRINQPDFDPAKTVIMETPSGCDLGQAANSINEVTIDEMEPGYWRMESNSDQPGILVLAESNFSGWQAMIDGEKADILTAYTVLKAVCVPEGNHTIEWRYQPISFWLGGAISLFFAAIIGLAIIKERKLGGEAELSSSGDEQALR